MFAPFKGNFSFRVVDFKVVKPVPHSYAGERYGPNNFPSSVINNQSTCPLLSPFPGSVEPLEDP